MAAAPLDIDDFATSLLQERGLGDVPEEVLQQLHADLKERIENQINATVLENMPPEKLAEFETLLDEGDEEKTRAFCAATIPDLDTKIAASLIGLKETYTR